MTLLYSIIVRNKVFEIEIGLILHIQKGMKKYLYTYIFYILYIFYFPLNIFFICRLQSEVDSI